MRIVMNQVEKLIYLINTDCGIDLAFKKAGLKSYHRQHFYSKYPELVEAVNRYKERHKLKLMTCNSYYGSLGIR